MIALDTNVLVRYLNNDHPKLSPRALTILESGDCYVSRVVLLETFQVLESVYALQRRAILHALRTLSQLKGVILEDADGTVRAIEWYESGLDFPDALVLSAAAGSQSLATFDKDFAKLSRRLKTVPQAAYRG